MSTPLFRTAPVAITILCLTTVSVAAEVKAGPVAAEQRRQDRRQAKAERTPAASLSRAPNFVVILTDDQGYADLGSFGSQEISTPNLDRMAREGIRLTNFYAQAVCGPSRAALLTGCYPIRVAEPGNRKHQHTILHTKEITIAEVLKEAGYTCACIGKWHLGQRQGESWVPETMPNGQGFDYFFGTPLYNGFTVHVADTKFRSSLLRNREVAKQAIESWDNITRDYTAEAIRFLREHRDRPFFLYLAHNMPHIPLGASAGFKGRSKYGPYGDAVEELDWSTGEVLKALGELGLDESTLVVFTSDNGPWIETTRGNKPGGAPLIPRNHSGNADPLRGYKMVTWEGGLRVPCVMRWPGNIAAGGTCDEMAATIDLLPTFAKLAGVSAPRDRQIDGKDIGPLLLGEDSRSPHRVLCYFSYTHLQAIRDRRFKLVLPRPEYPKWTGFSGRFFGDGVGNTELYDLGADAGETRNVAAANPEVVKRLMQQVEAKRAELGDYDRIGQGARFFDDGPRRPGIWKGAAAASGPKRQLQAVPYDRAQPVGSLRFDFETGDLQGWRIVEGTLESPVSNRKSLPRWTRVPFNRQGDYHLSTVALAQPRQASDRQMAVLESPVFLLTGKRMSFLVGGGTHPQTRVALCTPEGTELLVAHGIDSPVMQRVDWDVSAYAGSKLVLRLIDRRQMHWGHLTFDDFSCEGVIVH